MEYSKRAGRKTFHADVTHDERADWAIRSGRYQAILAMTGPEAEAWVEAGKPAEPAELPARIEAFLAKVAASGKPVATGGPKKVKYATDSFVPLDGEERAWIQVIERGPHPESDPRRFTTARVRCSSPRCTDTREEGWLVVHLPGSRYDKATGGVRVEGITAHEFVERHRQWHRETNLPTASSRVALSEWINRHKDVQFPDLTEEQERENRLALAIAKSER